jgi:hypothetical protein
MDLRKNRRARQEMKNELIDDNPGRAEVIIEVLKNDKEKNYKTEVIVTKDDHEDKVHSLYYSIIKL